MKYFKVFNTESEYLEYVSSKDFISPNVSTLRDSTNTWINPELHDYRKDYFTIESLEDNNEIKLYRGIGGGRMDTLNIAASTDGGNTWMKFALDGSIENTTDITTLNQGEKVMFKYVSGAISRAGSSHTKIVSTASFNVYGNVMSFVSAGDFTTATTLYWYNCPLQLLKGSSVVSAENLVLPATTLASSSYRNMFDGCTLLTTAPSALPATTLETRCYYSMFKDCTSLTETPELPATTLANECYMEMFKGCTSLTATTELAATTLAIDCYRSMFDGCTSLTTTPELPATTLATRCYRSMFGNCTNLEEAPELPATTLADGCYYYMFGACTSLTTAPELPATTLVNNCYSNMFQNCTSLTTAPELPATTLANSCYQSMFQGCINLTTAPELPATTLVDNCYHQMFKDCNNLNYIKCLATDISAENCTYEWVYHVQNNSGTFVKNSLMGDWTRDKHGIPTNWTVRNDTYVEVTGVTISASAATVNKGNTYTLTASVLPSNADDQVVSWSTSDSSVATVSNGVVTGVGCGNATITVTTHEKDYTATCNMSVENHVTSVDLNTYIVTLATGNTYQLEAIVSPSDACDKSVTWLSSNSGIASVDSNGLVSGVTTGSATVTVTSNDTNSATCNCSVTVNEGQHATGVTLSDTAITVNKDKTYALTATVTPADAVNKNVIWSSSNSGIASVDSNGVVSGVASGNATITVTTVDGGFTAQCSVSVTNAPNYFTIESLANNNTIKIGKAKSPSNISLSYSTDNGATWTDLTISTGRDFATINTGDKIMFKGTNDKISTAWDAYYRFCSTGNFKVYGNAMSLLWGDDFESHSEFKTGTTHNLCSIFRETTTLIDASGLILPALTCTTSCYNGMFRGCTNLSVGPSILPATEPEHDCYSSMFEGCINLETAPEISLTSMAQTCCMRMFCMDRSSEITSPKMTKSPILRCATGATNCYQEMFKGNGNLVEVTCLLTSNFQCSNWLTNCSSTGTFKKASSASWSSGTSGIPNGWEVVDYTE